MGVYGRMEIEYYQLTPMGVQKIQSGRLLNLGPSERQILKELTELGGTAEIDELKFYGTLDSPMALRHSLKRLMDLGYVTPVALEQPAIRG